MAKMSFWIKVVVTLSVLMCIISLVGVKWMHSDSNLSSDLLEYCEKNNVVQFENITDFEWDIAYIDKEPYSIAQSLREMGIEGDFTPLESDSMYRIAFCKNNVLIDELLLNNCYISISDNIDKIVPKTAFLITKDKETILLSPMGQGDGSPS